MCFLESFFAQQSKEVAGHITMNFMSFKKFLLSFLCFSLLLVFPALAQKINFATRTEGTKLRVTLSSSNNVYYTTDGSEPGNGSEGGKNTVSFLIDRSLTVKAKSGSSKTHHYKITMGAAAPDKPEVTKPFPVMAWAHNLPDQSFPLSDYFKGDGLTYTVKSNSGASTTAKIVNDALVVGLPVNGADKGTIVVEAKNTAGGTVTNDLVYTVTASDILYRVNAGGNHVSDVPMEWSQDSKAAASAYLQNGGASHTSNVTISKFADMVDVNDLNTDIFKTQRYCTSGAMSYEFPMRNGDYTLRIYMADAYQGTSNIGDRVFDINVNGQTVKKNFDIVAAFGFEVGGFVEVPVHVTANKATLSFTRISGKDNPVVAGVELLNHAKPTYGVSLTSPENNAEFNVGATVDFQVNTTGHEVDSVAYFGGDHWLTSSNNGGNNFKSTHVFRGAGVKMITAKSYDDGKEVATSTAHKITVNEVHGELAWYHPAEGSLHLMGSTADIQVEPREFTPDKVDFYCNDQLVGTATKAPFAVKYKFDQAQAVFVAKSYYNDQLVAETNQRTLVVVDPSVVVMNIANPVEGQKIVIGSKVKVQLEGNKKFIDQVKFYLDGQLVNTTEQPFDMELDLAQTADHTLKAEGYWGTHLLATSEIKFHVVKPDEAILTLNTPVNGKSYDVNEQISFSSTLEHAQADQVEYLLNGKPFASDDDAVKSIDEAGDYQVQALAMKDGKEVAKSATHTIHVLEEASIAWNSPENGHEMVKGHQLKLQATPNSSTIDYVAYYFDGTEVGRVATAPYALNYVPEASGEINITAKSIIDGKTVAVTPQRTITVTDPSTISVSISNPTEGQVFEVGDQVDMGISGDFKHIARVDYYLNGNKAVSASVVPFSAVAALNQAGAFIVTAKIYGANELLLGEATNKVNIEVTSPDNAVMSFVAPNDGDKFGVSNSVKLKVDIKGTDQVDEVKYFANGRMLHSVSDGPNYEVITSFGTPGSQKLQAVAYDSEAREVVKSSEITIEVEELGTIAWLTPGDQSEMLINKTYNFEVIADGFVPTKVVYFDGNQQIGETDASPYQISAAFSQLGTHQIKAVAYRGTSVVDEIVRSVNVVALPVFALSQPLDGTSYNEGEAVNFAIGTNNLNLVKKVAYLVDDEVVAERSEAPFTASVRIAGTGLKQAVARVYLNNETQETKSVSFNMVPKTQVTVRLVNPTNGQVFAPQDRMPLAVELSQGDVNRVDYLIDGNVVESVNQLPFASEYLLENAGAHTVEAKAYYQNSLVATSAAVSITVEQAVDQHIAILNPIEDSKHFTNESISVQIEAVAKSVSSVLLYVDNQIVDELSEFPFNTSVSFEEAGTYKLRAEMITEDGTVSSEIINITVINDSETPNKPVDGQVYPTAVQDHLNVVYTAQENVKYQSITIVDMSGVAVYHKELNNATSINEKISTSNFGQGVFFVRVIGSQTDETTKIMKF